MYVNVMLMVMIMTLVFVLGGCTWGQLAKLEKVGQEPPLQAIENPVDKSPPIRWPASKSQQSYVKTANSLWSPGSRTFFRDQRAHQVGDILLVKVSIKDKAELDNKTERKRSSTDSVKIPKVFGMEDQIAGLLPGKGTKADLLNTTGSMDNKGEGLIEREEEIETEIAAVVTQVLPNGNLVIYGSQEVRVNFEVRQLTIKGVVRSEDISPENTVQSNQIAEARISYGGQGLITDVQQPRIGSQVIDILSPW